MQLSVVHEAFLSFFQISGVLMCYGYSSKASPVASELQDDLSLLFPAVFYHDPSIILAICVYTELHVIFILDTNII